MCTIDYNVLIIDGQLTLELQNNNANTAIIEASAPVGQITIAAKRKEQFSMSLEELKEMCWVADCSTNQQLNHSLAISSITVVPTQSVYEIGDTPTIEVIALNDGNTVIDSLTVDVTHEPVVQPNECEIFDVTVTPANTSAQVRWSIRDINTQALKGATGQTCYGTDPSNLNVESNLESSFISTHVQNIPNGGDPNLVSGTTYYYEIKSVAQSGELITYTGSFTTT